MSEWYAGGKASVFLAPVVGGLLSMPFMKMTLTQRAVAIVSGAIMAQYIGEPVALWLGADLGMVGFLIGLFGVSICSLIFDSIKKSDLSVKFADIIELFKR